MALGSSNRDLQLNWPKDRAKAKRGVYCGCTYSEVVNTQFDCTIASRINTLFVAVLLGGCLSGNRRNNCNCGVEHRGIRFLVRRRVVCEIMGVRVVAS